VNESGTGPLHIRILKEALTVARTGQFDKAIVLLEAALKNPELTQDSKWLFLLESNAGLLCQEAGNLREALGHYKEALRFGGDDVPTLFGIADICVRLNEKENAKAYYRRCHELAAAQDNQTWLKILENRAEFWK
jgi:tetratricopeptide (TPR) repeat protein